jgi:uncharacterized alpha-E superfamily protein
VPPGAPSALGAPRQFEHHLLQMLGDRQAASSVGWNLQALAGCAQGLRERLSTDHWQLIHQLGHDFVAGMARAQADELDTASVLAATDRSLSALIGAQNDRMTRDDGWRLLSVGRQIERLHFLADVLQQAFVQQVHESDEGFALLLGLFDSTITYRAQFQGRREVAPLLHLLVMDADNPRGLARVAHTLRERFLKLSRHEPVWATGIAQALPAPDDWSLAALSQQDEQGRYTELLARLSEWSGQVLTLSTEIGRKLFAHVAAPERRVWQ